MKISTKLAQLYKHLSTSYWCIPAALMFFSVVLAIFTAYLDRKLDGKILFDILYFDPVEPQTARVLLSMIAGSIIGVAGVVFSITMVAVSFASGNFGPRLIGNLLRDRGSQFSLGIFIGTFVYALLILRSVRSSDELVVSESSIIAFTPYISIGTSIGLALLCMGVLIYFIHHVPETINIERIIANLGQALKTGIEERFPDGASDTHVLRAEEGHWIDDADPKDALKISLDTDGYIQTLNLKNFNDVAGKYALHVEILERPGCFVSTIKPVMQVWSKDTLSTDVCDELRACFATGISPTVNQNIEFVADQLVEIIARALSPGVNDPFTAIAAINWLQVGVVHFATHEKTVDAFNQNQRIYSKPFLFRDFVQRIFPKAFPYIVTDRNVSRHTLDVLASIADVLPAGNNLSVIEDVAKELEEMIIQDRT